MSQLTIKRHEDLRKIKHVEQIKSTHLIMTNGSKNSKKKISDKFWHCHLGQIHVSNNLSWVDFIYLTPYYQG